MSTEPTQPAHLKVLAAWTRVLAPTDVPVLVPGRVWSASGADGIEYALKRQTPLEPADRESSDPAPTIRRLVDQARILSFLAQQGLPVGVPVLCDDGRVYASDGADGLYTLTPMLPVDHSGTGRLEQASPYENVGATLARLHVALARCPYPIELPGHGRSTSATRPRRCARRQHPQRPSRGHRHHRPRSPAAGTRHHDLGYYLALCVHARLERGATQDEAEHVVAFEAEHLLAGYRSVSSLTDGQRAGLPAIAIAVAVALLDYFLRTAHSIEHSWLDTIDWIVTHPAALWPAGHRFEQRRFRGAGSPPANA